MTKTVVRAKTPQLCIEGGCDLAGPKGTIRVSILEATTVNDRRDQTAFELEYIGTRAQCRGPTKGPNDNEVPFACSIVGSSANSSKRVLVLQPGCTQGILHEVDPTGEKGRLGLETDVVKVAGFLGPGREVALSDDRRVLAFSDRPNPYELLFFTPPRAALPPSELLAMVAMHTFVNLDGYPTQCRLTE